MQKLEAMVWQLKITNISSDHHTDVDFSRCIAEPTRLFTNLQSARAAARHYMIDHIKLYWPEEIENYPEQCRSAFDSNGNFVPSPSMSLADIRTCYNVTFDYEGCPRQEVDVVAVPVYRNDLSQPLSDKFFHKK